MPDIPVLGKILDGLQVWQDQVVQDKIKGHLLRLANEGVNALDQASPLLEGGPGLGHAITSGIPMVGPVFDMLNPNQADASEASSKGLVGKEWVDAAYKNSPWQDFASGAVLDPMNLVGLGIPGKLATAVPAGTKLAQALKVANVIDKAPGVITKPVFDYAGKGANKVLQGAGNVAAPVTEAIARRFPDESNAASNTMKAWREQALISPGYHIRNATENILQPLLRGDTETAKEAVRGLFTGTNKFDEKATEYGFNTHPDVMKAINQDPTGTATSGSVFRKAGFTPETRTMRMGNIPEGVPEGTVLGNVGDFFGQPLRRGVVMDGDLVQAGDKAMYMGPRGAAQGEIQGVIEMTGGPDAGAHFVVNTPTGPELVPQAKLISHEPGPGIPTATRLNDFQRGANYVAEKAGDLSDFNRQVGTHVEGSARKAAIVNGYERAVASGASQEDAVQAGIKYANDLFFNYEDIPGGVDSLGRNVLAFHKFALHNIPTQLRQSGAKPALLNVPNEYYGASDRYNEQHGLTSRFHGEMPLGDEGLHINPMALYSLADVVGAATKKAPEEGTWLGQTADTGREIGLGLNPFIDALLTVTGQHGQSFAPGFLRASQPVNGILSSVMGRPVDIEGGPKALLGGAQEALGNGKPFPYQEYLLQKRQAELGAFGKDESRAGSNVGDQMAVEGLAGFLGVPGLKYLSPEEQMIRHNQQLANAYRVAGNQAAVRANPTAGAYADVDPGGERAKVQDLIENYWDLSPDERRRLFNDPSVRDQLFDRLAQQLHNAGNKTGSAAAQAKHYPNPFARPGKSYLAMLEREKNGQ